MAKKCACEVRFGVKVGNSTFRNNLGMLNTIGPVTKLNFVFFDYLISIKQNGCQIAFVQTFSCAIHTYFFSLSLVCILLMPLNIIP